MVAMSPCVPTDDAVVDEAGEINGTQLSHNWSRENLRRANTPASGNVSLVGNPPSFDCW